MDSDENDFYIGEQPPINISTKTEIIQTGTQKYNIQTPMKFLKFINSCKILKISDVCGTPLFYFEINGKMYSYGIKGVEADYKIRLQCSITKKVCGNLAVISPSEKGKLIIRDTPSGQKSKFPKFLDNLDPRIYDRENYDVNSFKIYGYHKCRGTDIIDYYKNNKRTAINSPSEMAECIEKTEPIYSD
jgi:hypothetical protein